MIAMIFTISTRKRLPFLLIAFGCALLMLAALVSARPAQAQAVEPAAIENAQQETPAKLSNAYCLLCHAQPDQVWILPSNQKVSLTIDPAVLDKSVHGSANPEGALMCADCHIDYRFPHPVQTVQTARQFTLSRYATCRTCHEDQYTRSQDSVHGAALRAGHTEAAVCVDCHGAHDIQKPDVPRERISLTCGKCHGAIFDEYRTSVHGAALLGESNPDVPTCIDCHGVHGISDATSALFRVRSPELCAQCHANGDLMAKYNISTDVFDSYLTDFHGSTVALFEQQDPNTATNKAVCYDCHGVHSIKSVKAGDAQPVRDNLLTACRQCHPDATANFPDAWVGHYPATMEAHPALTVADGLYRVLVPGAVGAMVILIGADVFRRVRRLLGGNGQKGVSS